MRFKSFIFPKDLNIILVIPFKIAYFRRLVNRKGFNYLISGFEGNHFTLDADSIFIEKLNKYYKATTFFLIKVFKDPNPCMIRSLILYQLCGKNSVKASLVTGVNKIKGVLSGHSWIVINGEPFNENKSFVSSFTVISEV